MAARFRNIESFVFKHFRWKLRTCALQHLLVIHLHWFNIPYRLVKLAIDWLLLGVSILEYLSEAVKFAESYWMMIVLVWDSISAQNDGKPKARWSLVILVCQRFNKA